MKVLIVEDEAYAAKNLIRKLEEVAPEAEVLTVIPDVKSGLNWFQSNETPDLILSDIQLADGLSFDIYSKAGVVAPIIFTTAFDQYAIEAFKLNSVNYLLKPVQSEDLRSSLEKFHQIKEQYSRPDMDHLASFLQGQRFRSRMLVYHGEDIIPVEMSDVAYFHSHSGETHLITKAGEEYLVSDSLEAIEKQVDPTSFYRANRQYLISTAAIAKVKQHFNRKLKLILKPGKEELFVSKEKVSDFKTWLGG